jgi:uncharacterized protein (TIGR03083 family)
MPDIPAVVGHDHVALLRAERAALLDLLATLRPSDWDRPTACPGWSVLDLCGHLLGDDLSGIARHRDGHFGTPPPAGVDDGGFADWLDGLNDEWVAAMRRLSPRLVCELLADTGRQLADAFADQDPSARTAHVSWASDEPVPLWLDHARELTERWVHQQQVRQAVNRPTWLEAGVTSVVLDCLRWAYPKGLRHCRRPAGTAVAIHVVDLDGTDWRLVSHGGPDVGDWRYELPGPKSPAPAAEANLTVDQAWRSLTNNLTAAERAALPLSGDTELVAALAATRAIIARPDALPAS